MGQFAFGQSVARTEDPRLLTGRGNYVNDVNLHRQTHAYVLRSPYAHAKILSMDISAAKAAPGVLAVLTGVDIRADGLGVTKVTFPHKRADGSPLFSVPHPGLVSDRVRYVGDYVAFIVAETLAQAKDAAELVEIDYEPLDAITDTASAPNENGPIVWDECFDNVSNIIPQGDKEATDAAFEKADHVIKQRFVINRISANPMEMRGCIGDYDQREGRYVVYSDIQAPHALRQVLSEDIFNVPQKDVQVIAGNVGGAFGMKGPIYPEIRLCAWASKRIGRPVKWSCDRSEAFQSDEHCRDNVSEAEIAISNGGKFLGLRVNTICNIGAYLSQDRNLLSTFLNLGVLAGVYTTPAIHVKVTNVFTNTNATSPYRGAGRPEAAYIIESMADLAAKKLGMDKTEIRRKNIIPVDAMPFKTGLTYTYDCGEFEKNMDRVMEMIDYAGFEARREEAKSRGMLRGIAISNSIERAGAPMPETVEVRFDPTGTVTILAGTKDQGQGHDTMYKMLLSDKLGIDTDDMRLVDGDTDKVSHGLGTFGSRSAMIGGTALTFAAEKLIEKGTKIAAEILEAAEADISFEDGSFKIAGTDRSIDIQEISKIAYNPMRVPKGIEPGFAETGVFKSDTPSFPNGCHGVEVEIDPETGKTELVSYYVVDDVGNVINPLTLKGQIYGGVAQGVGQALMENIAFDKESGQLLSGSFMDYAMPRADDFCTIKIESNPVPTAVNPLGVKGAGEAGCVGALPAVLSAVTDALNVAYGIDYIEMPATSVKVWKAIQVAQAT
ncbi:MAG: xanthine dehydrogenase family protein molybdopterin-binding subunit [Rhodospirillales bacterium]